MILFYRYAVKYIPSDTIRIPLKVFSRIGSDGMIRLPTSEEEAAHISSTFLDDHSDEEGPFHDEDDDDIPPLAKPVDKPKLLENEQDFFNVSDGEDDEEDQSPRQQGEETRVQQS